MQDIHAKEMWVIDQMKRHFVSYPKSGRSWIRYALTLLSVADDIHFHHAGFEFNDGAKPPHNFDYRNMLKTYSSKDRIVYLARDPRDLMVSLFFQIKGRFKDFFKYSGDISAFIRDDYFGAHNLKKFRDLWDCFCSDRGYLKITYEECHLDMNKVLIRITDYYGLCCTEQEVRKAVESSTFDKMREVETSETFSEPWLRPRNDTLKVRRGVVEGYRDYLDEKDIMFLNNIFKIE
jgi:hypothetical protein